MGTVVERLKRWAGSLKAEVYALYLAACVVGYAFSPIDLIPDPIPVVGYLDDLVLVPLGIALAVRMIPPEVLAESARRPGRSWRRANR